MTIYKTDSEMGNNSGTMAPSGGSSFNWGSVSSISGSIGSIYNTYEQGKLIEINAEHNAVMAQFDAWYAQEAAKRERKAIKEDADQQVSLVARRAALLQGSARAINSASGFATSSKTNLDVEGDIATGAAMDIAVIRRREIRDDLEAELAGAGRVRNYQSKASAYKTEGNLAQTESNLNQVNNVMKLGKQISSMYT